MAEINHDIIQKTIEESIIKKKDYLILKTVADNVTVDLKTKMDRENNVWIPTCDEAEQYESEGEPYPLPCVIVRIKLDFDAEQRTYDTVQGKRFACMLFPPKTLPCTIAPLFDIFAESYEEAVALGKKISEIYDEQNRCWFSCKGSDQSGAARVIGCSVDFAPSNTTSWNYKKNGKVEVSAKPCPFGFYANELDEIESGQMRLYRKLQEALFYYDFLPKGDYDHYRFPIFYRNLTIHNYGRLMKRFGSNGPTADPGFDVVIGTLWEDLIPETPDLALNGIKNLMQGKKPIPDDGIVWKAFPEITMAIPNLRFFINIRSPKENIEALLNRISEDFLNRFQRICREFDLAQSRYVSYGRAASLDSEDALENMVYWLEEDMSLSIDELIDRYVHRKSEQAYRKYIERQEMQQAETERGGSDGSFVKTAAATAAGVYIGERLASKASQRSQSEAKYTCSISCPYRGKDYGPTKCRRNPSTCGHGVKYWG